MRRRFTLFARFVLAFNLAVILWGALVRASGSGEGCGDRWPLCNGVVIPHAAQIATLIEFTHRATTGIAFLSVVAMAIWAFLAFRREPVWPAAVASLILILTEALLGAGLVLFKYVGSNVSTGRVIYLSAHLVNTLLLLAAMTLTAWWASGHRSMTWTGRGAILTGVALVAALAIAVTGSMTALSDTLFPVSSFAHSRAAALRAGLSADFSSASPALVRLRIWHPLVATAAGIYLVIVASLVEPARKWMRAAIAGLVAAQLTSGALNIYLLTPVWLQLTHLLLADLLWIALVLFTAAVLERSPALAPASELVHS